MVIICSQERGSIRDTSRGVLKGVVKNDSENKSDGGTFISFEIHVLKVYKGQITPKILHVKALGGSRGGFSSQIHLLCDGQGLSLAVDVSGGQEPESRYFETLNPLGKWLGGLCGCESLRFFLMSQKAEKLFLSSQKISQKLFLLNVVSHEFILCVQVL